jgi:hypothetical protein
LQHFLEAMTPYAIKQTPCASCRSRYPVSEFAWTDTGENLQARWDRLYAYMPGDVKFLRHPVGAWVGIAAGIVPVAVAGYVLGGQPALGVVGGMASAFFFAWCLDRWTAFRFDAEAMP